MRPLRVVLTAATLASSVLIGMAVSVGTAAADTYAKLPITSFGDLVVDSVHQRVFVSDPGSGKIVATDFQGRFVAELTGLPGVRGLVLSADSSRLYAAVTRARALVAVSTATVTEAARYPVGDEVYPGEVVTLGDRLWFGYDTSETSDDSGDFGSVDLDTSDVHLHDYAADLSAGLYYGPPRLAVSPSRPGVLVASDVTSSAAAVNVYDVSTGTAKLAGRWRAASGLTTTDIAFTADGTQLIRVDYRSRQSIDVDTPVGTEIYRSWTSTYAMGTSSDGRIAVATDEGVQIYAQGATEPTQKVSMPLVEGANPATWVRRHGLAWEPGGNRLFTVVDGFWLLVLNDPSTKVPTSSPPTKPAITLNQPSFNYARPGTPFTITGKSAGLPAGAALTVTRISSESPSGQEIATVVPDSTGAFSFTDTLTVEGQATYLVRYPGTGNWDRLETSLSIYAYKQSVTLSINGNGWVSAYGATVTFTAWLRAWDTNRTVEIWADPAGNDQPKRLVKKGPVDDGGKISVSLRLTRNTVLSATYAGDGVYAASVTAATTYTRVAVNTAITRHFKTKKIGSQTYYVVRTTKDPYFTTTMTAYPNRFYRLVVEKYSGGKWKSYKTALLGLDSKGKSIATITGYYPAGTRFRVHSEYGVTANTDTVNAKTYGAWRYYTYAK
ncbi:hypothetical protein BJ973_007355 [Actinoplanes tereljensis]|uniref:Ig-like domain repeat protein n=1 Tax=Paractinoplanes tereljensis TaxID=571912 RepID=A0A919TYB3_9ACTN|nr:hypothetical protein [Actinoplanes tereljensis]GIF25100.1 hypothetical protein Ate02nite_78300 [Actinoplanes tereljensis]